MHVARMNRTIMYMALLSFVFLSRAQAVVPTDLPNLSAWWDAGQGATLDGARVSQWNDRSSHGNNLTTWAYPELRRNVVNGNNVMHFDGSNFFIVSESQSNGPLDFGNNATFFVVLRPSGTSNYTILGKRGVDASTIGFQWHANSDALYKMSFYGSTFSSLYSSPVLGDGEFQILEMNFDVARTGSDIQLYVNGNSAGSSGNLGAGFALSNYQLTIGTEDWVGNNFQGDIAEIVLYKSTLNSTDRTGIGQYLAGKYAIKAYGHTPTGYFQPTDLSNLSGWWKAGKGLTLSGSDITTWADQSSNGLNLTTWNGVAYQPNYEQNSVNGSPAVKFDGSSFFVRADPGANSPLDFGNNLSAFVVIRTTNTGNYTILGKRGSGSIDYQWHLNDYAPGYFSFYSSTTPTFYSTRDVLRNDFQILELNFDVVRTSQDFRLYINSDFAGASGNLANGILQDDSQLTVGTQDWVGQNLVGSIAELILYKSTLSDTDRNKVGQYLAGKYRLAAYGYTPPQNSFPGSGEWASWRANKSLDGHVKGTGRLTSAPSLIWSYYIGKVSSLMTATPGTGNNNTTIPVTPFGSDPSDSSWDQRWNPEKPYGLIQGSVQAIPQDSERSYWDVNGSYSGWEKFELLSAYSGDQYKNIPLKCYGWNGANWTQIWQSANVPDNYGNYPLVGDFDNDGTPEVAVAPLYRVMVFNALTGATEQNLSFTSRRNAGFFSYYDMNGDGKKEFLVISDHSHHYEVLGYNGSNQLVKLWGVETDDNIVFPTNQIKVIPDPAGDFDGDGTKEVVINLYNGSGDGKWHMLIYNGMGSGGNPVLEVDSVDEVAQDIVDINGDGRPELLTVQTNGQGIPAYGPIRIRTESNNTLTTLWSSSTVGWQIVRKPIQLNRQHNTVTSYSGQPWGVLTRTVSGQVHVVTCNTTSNPGEVTLNDARWLNGTLSFGMVATGPGANAESMDSNGVMLFRNLTKVNETKTVSVQNGQPAVTNSRNTGIPTGAEKPAPPVVAKQANGQPLIVAQGYEDDIVGFEANNGAVTAERWRLKGYGQATAWPGSYGPVIADLYGSGGRQVIYGSISPAGNARVQVSDLSSGSALWNYDFTDIVGQLPVYNYDGLVYFQPGNFTDPIRQDILATIRWFDHRYSAALISSLGKNKVWVDDVLTTWTASGFQYAMADFDRDGLDDGGNLWSSGRFILDGEDGHAIMLAQNTWNLDGTGKTYYNGLGAVAGLFDLTNKPSLLWCDYNPTFTGRVNTNGDLNWYGALGQSPNNFAAIGNFDSDSYMEAVRPGYSDGVRCYNTYNGTLKWTLGSVAGQSTGAVSGDIDGDGRDEALFIIGTTLYCVGANAAGTTGSLEWSYALPSSAGPVIAPPTLAYTEASNQPRGQNLCILITGQDGYVYCLETN